MEIDGKTVLLILISIVCIEVAVWVLQNQVEDLDARLKRLEPKPDKIDWEMERLKSEDRFAATIGDAVASAVAAKL
jgi:chaperonin cofactor prefoldin